MSYKPKFYQLLKQQAEGLLYGESNLIANAANLGSLLYHILEDVNWVGFYFHQDNELVLGPFQGQVACTRIALGQGVCGTAFSCNKTLRIADVHAFKGHIACDSASNSELVIPLNVNNKTIGVLDIDSPAFDRFDEYDQKGCEEIVKILLNSIEI
ncbi:Free methionine-(R)-sulfoxide reductase, contains GAF domain [hydrothermal vent metagenome]|uniref:Free methionine-(R)-sulfoxide reductase, contains GAF domain n=1 Tax=hydrothermal vent metagenome TaxID=652676 RepID=A0A3B0VMQ2_9ZZZZ